MTDHSPTTLRTLIEQAIPEIELRFRKMFGGIIAYANERPFASLSNRGLALKLAPTDRTALLTLPGARPLQYEPDDPPSKTYTLLPDTMLANQAARTHWLTLSIRFTSRKSKPPVPSPKPPTSPMQTL